MKTNDSHIDALLRDIKSPTGLHARLKEIPDAEDRAISQLLASVEVPTDLRRRLIEIPELEQFYPVFQDVGADDQQSKNELKQSKHTSITKDKRTLRAVVVAASVLVALACLTPWIVDQYRFHTIEGATAENDLDPPGFDSAIVKTDQFNDPVDVSLKELDDQIAAVEREIALLEQQRLRERLLPLDGELTLASVEAQFASDRVGLTLTWVAESAMLVGVDGSIVKNELKMVTERFPDSPGARRAADLLSSLN